MEKVTGNITPQLPPALRKPRLRRWEAAEYLNLVHGITIAPTTLSKKAWDGTGPKFQKFDGVGTPLYPKEELDAWAADKLGKAKSSSSDTGAA